MRKLAAIAGSSGLIGAMLLCSSLPARAEPVGNRALPSIERAYPNESYAQYRYRPRHYHHHYYHRPRRYYRDDGAGLALGAAGLAAGVLIGSAIASQAQAAPPPPPGTVDPTVAAYCARKYRSYDPVTGTFLSTNGMRYVCTYP